MPIGVKFPDNIDAVPVPALGGVPEEDDSWLPHITNPFAGMF